MAFSRHRSRIHQYKGTPTVAWLERENTGIYQVCFRFDGERIKKSARTRDLRKAQSMMGRVDENIQLIQKGRLVVPEDADLFTFLISDGQINGNAKKRKRLKLDELFAKYSGSLPDGALAPETLRIAEIHFNHVLRILGTRRQLSTVRRDDLQRYINVRSKEIGKRNKRVSAGTIRKEISTFRTLWGWARQSEFVDGSFPNSGLAFPRERQKLPFSTWDQIELRIRRGIPEGHTAADYWDCLYLNTDELDQLLDCIRQNSVYDFLHPMAMMAAHTGARRSELCRSLRDDIDFESGSLLVREKKRQKGRETFRHVPLSPRLRSTLLDWFSIAPLSVYTFPADHRVSRKRNANRRENSESVSPDEATDHLSQTLSRTRWGKIRGWHIFRHSFISNCASRCVDQRMIDAWVGHQTDDMRKRYRHLFPSSQTSELARVFG
jgi:integrase